MSLMPTEKDKTIADAVAQERASYAALVEAARQDLAARDAEIAILRNRDADWKTLVTKLHATSDVYRHHKGGLYRVLFHAHEATNARAIDGGPTTIVVYVSLTHGGLFVRDAMEFYGTVEAGPRFAPVSAAEQDEWRRAGHR